MENKTFKETIEKIVREFQPDKILLFGSRAEGTNHSESDYDICILKEEFTSKNDMLKELYACFIGSFLAVDIIFEKTSEFEKKKSTPFLVYYDIAKKGIPLYVRN